MPFRVKDLKTYGMCPTKFLLDTKNKKQGFPFIYFNESLVEAARKYFNINEEDIFVGSVGQTSEETLEGMKDKTWACHARFEKNNLRIKVTFLKKEEDGYIYYALCKTCWPRVDEAKRLYIEKWLLEQEGIHIKHIELVHLNALYEREETLDYSLLFKTSSTFYKDANKPGKVIDDVVESIAWPIENDLESMKKLLEADAVPNEFQINCTKHGKCDRYYECFEEENIPDDSILFMNGTRKKYDLFAEGKTSMKDVTFGEDVDGTWLQYAQLKSCLDNREYVETYTLKHWLDHELIYPYTYVDFEWDTYGIPPYSKMKPYDVLVFQYSIHIDDKENIIHKEYLGNGGDTREEFIQSLLQDIPSTGSVIAYHADGAEKLRLLELAHQFPQYEKQLKSICERMVDLTYPIMQGMYYHPSMRGTYSLKCIYKIINNNHGYNELDIGHGLEAVEAYRLLDTLENKEEIRKELLDYCGLDTYACVKLVRYLQEKVKERIEENRG